MPHISTVGDRFYVDFKDMQHGDTAMARLIPGEIKTNKKPSYTHIWPVTPFVALRMHDEWKEYPITTDEQFNDIWWVGYQCRNRYKWAMTVPIEELPPHDFGREPWEHQIRALAFLSGIQHGALFAEMRTGKTQVVLELMKIRQKEMRDKDLHVLVLAPKMAVSGWISEAAEIMPDLITYDLDGPIKERIWLVEDLKRTGPHGSIMMVTNYDALVNPRFVDALVEYQFDMVVLDEAHKIKTPSAITHKAACRIGKNVRWRVIMTGTPAADNPTDVYGIYKFLEPSIFGTKQEFLGEYTIQERKRNAKGQQWTEIVDYINLDDLNQRMYDVAFRVTQDVLSLPKELDVNVPVKADPDTLKLYRSMMKESALVIGESAAIASNTLTKVLRMQQLSSGFITMDDGKTVRVSSEKQEALAELLETANGEPVVVFYRFEADLLAVFKTATENGYRTFQLNGHADQKEQFQTGQGRDLIAVQLQSGNAGVDLSRSSIVIYYSNSYSLETYEQSRSRVLKNNKIGNVTYYHLLSVFGAESKSVDYAIMAALQSKSNITTYLVDWLTKQERNNAHGNAA